MTNDKTPVFFVGIGGIGMSALARYFLYYGYTVGGYDRVRTPNTIALEEQGARILYQDNPDELPPEFRAPSPFQVVYTPAIHEDNHLRQYFSAHGYPQVKRAKVLGEITRRHRALCVAGTHGKTTTCTLLTHLLRSSHIGANAFLGGISLNYRSNLLLDEASPYVVVEADEYDRSFHQLHPDHAIITATEPDHLDIYGTAEAFHEAFDHFAGLIPSGGTLLVHEDALIRSHPDGVTRFTYGQRASSDYHYSHLTYDGGELYFDWHFPGGAFEKLRIGTPIEVNVLNATAALALAQKLGATEDELRQGLRTFLGAHRRFERTTLPDGRVVIDDYAHHPDEIRASLDSIHKLYPDHHVTVVFQPHLYSRTRDFLRAFGEALSVADDVLLIPIYPAREEPIPGITSDAILPHIQAEDKVAVTKEELIPELEAHHPFDILVMMGAGDIEFEIPKVIRHFSE